jgi:hypothetical protein
VGAAPPTAQGLSGINLFSVSTATGYKEVTFCHRRREHTMNRKPFLIAALLGLLLAAPTIALAQGKVTITTPAEGATLDAMAENRVVYDVDPGPRGDHVHVYVDNKEVGILRKLKGSYLLESLSPGPRVICIKVVNKAHVPVGIEQCVHVTVK